MAHVIDTCRGVCCEVNANEGGTAGLHSPFMLDKGRVFLIIENYMSCNKTLRKVIKPTDKKENEK